MMHTLVSDLRYAARELRRRPGFTATAVISLALGIGATSAVFSVIYAVLIDPFPYEGSERITQLSLKDKAGSEAEWYRRVDAYLAEPSEANLWAFYDGIDSLTEADPLSTAGTDDKGVLWFNANTGRGSKTRQCRTA